MKKSVELLIIISISIIAVIILNLLLSLDPNPEPNVGLRIFAYVIMSIWMFSVPASYVYFYRWWNKKPFQEGTLIGNSLFMYFPWQRQMCNDRILFDKT